MAQQVSIVCLWLGKTSKRSAIFERITTGFFLCVVWSFPAFVCDVAVSVAHFLDPRHLLLYLSIQKNYIVDAVAWI